ncbi:GGDEF domain-containing protein [Spirochaetia bacterium]|nr:GGDEF domain-containing protein [Spirochaetia bacterium]
MPRFLALLWSGISKWHFYNFTKEEYKGCSGAISRHNVQSLSINSIVCALIVFLLSFYPHSELNHRFFYYIISLFLLSIFMITRFLFTQKEAKVYGIGLSIWIFTFLLYFFCAIVYSLEPSPQSVRFLLVFLSFQILYVLGALLNILLNIFVVFIFLSVNIYVNRWIGIQVVESNIFDAVNIILAAGINITLNWFISHVIVKGILTSRTLENERNHFLEDSIRDQLTSLNNRRSFDQSVPFYISVCRHVHQTVCVLMMDVDYFKFYNDYYGHQKGDVVLQSIGKVLKEIGEEERIYTARVGGEEFIIMWTENRVAEAERVVLRLRQKINNMNIKHEKSLVANHVTASYGLYIMRGGSEDTAEELYGAADHALYEAKGAGRDCIMLHDSNDNSYRLVEIRSADEAGRQ